MSDERTTTSPIVSMTRAELQELLSAAISTARAPSPLEQQALEERIEKQKRLTLAMALAMQRREHGCSHKRAPHMPLDDFYTLMPGFKQAPQQKPAHVYRLQDLFSPWRT